MRPARIALLAAAVIALAAPAGAATVDVSPATLARAKAVYEQLENGTIDRSALTPDLSAVISAATLASIATRLDSVGEATSFSVLQQTDVDGVTTTVFRLQCPGGLVDYTFGTSDTTNKIAKVYFIPGPSP